MSQDSFNPGYPVLIYEEGMEMPEEGTFFVVAGNGLWMRKDTGVVRCFVPVDSISFLPDLPWEEKAACNLPPIPARTVWRIKEFFRRVVERHRSESCTVLYFNKEAGDYKVHIPEQYVSHGGVRYKRAALTHREDMAGYVPVGTIHSHCDFNAFHSGTDDEDEKNFDGLHVTFGHNDLDEFTVSASVVANGHRFMIDPVTALEGVVRTGGDRYRLRDSDFDRRSHEWAEGIDQWMDQIRSHANWFVPFNKDEGVKSKVVWADGVTANHMRGLIGDGPFEVREEEDEKLVLVTSIGLVKLSKNMFVEKVELS